MESAHRDGVVVRQSMQCPCRNAEASQGAEREGGRREGLWAVERIGWSLRVPRAESGGTNEKASEYFYSEACRFGAAGRNRTHDPLVRSQVLYPAELQPPSFEL